MGFQGRHDARDRIYEETRRHDYELGWNWNVFGLNPTGNNFRRDDLYLQSKEMYSVPMPAILNFHLKVDDNQQQQFQHTPNGMFLKKEIAINSQGQPVPVPPIAQAHSSHSQGIPILNTPILPQSQRQDTNFVLEHHMKVNKDHSKPYQCNYCSKSYKQLMGIKNHIKIHTQTNEGIHHCSLCGKTSPYENTGEKPFICSNCRDTKHQIQQQQQQQQQHHSQNQQAAHHSQSPIGYHHVKGSSSCDEEDESCPESEKHYSCQYCQKRFQHPSTLKMHLRKHTDDKPFVCSHCNKLFKRNSSLKIHERTHTGEKTHECSYCGKLFAYEVFLKVHLRKHTGEKPFSCQLCEKTFTQAGNLKSHVKRKHLGSESVLNVMT